ncbi:MAG: molybdopterin molybdotransferase MoeA [Phycisphaerales bacterium]|jgi:molybdopterin molybdotransferase|nr:molybdopterin molybdotransferase MoeA [Phycisphaerales bacterium]
MAELIDFERAIELVQSMSLAVTAIESCPLGEAMGRVLANGVVSDRDLPPFNRAAMDGYAFAHESASDCMPVAGARRAGEADDLTVPAGSCIGISTGAAVPPPCDTVVPFECTDRGDPVRVDGAIPQAGRHVHTQGSDAKEGDTLLSPGVMIGAAEVGIAAMVGCTTLSVRSRPRVALLTSGDEVVGEGVDPAPHQIRNSNGPMVAALTRRLGGHIERHEHLRDDLQSTLESIERAAESCEVVVTTGGISAGRHDHLPAACESLGCQWVISGVRMQPGKPVRVGTWGQKTIVCLPGNPVSALVTASLFLAPILRTCLGRNPAAAWRQVQLGADAKSNAGRTLLRPARLTSPSIASIPIWQGSGDLVHTASTSGIVRLPLSDRAAAGDHVWFTPWP